MPRKHVHRTDTNHHKVVKFFRDRGATVVDTSQVGGGFPDLIVGYRLFTVPVEVKTDETTPFTDKQRDWHAKFGGAAAIVRTDEDVARILKTIDAIITTIDRAAQNLEAVVPAKFAIAGLKTSFVFKTLTPPPQ